MSLLSVNISDPQGWVNRVCVCVYMYVFSPHAVSYSLSYSPPCSCYLLGLPKNVQTVFLGLARVLTCLALFLAGWLVFGLSSNSMARAFGETVAWLSFSMITLAILLYFRRGIQVTSSRSALRAAIGFRSDRDAGGESTRELPERNRAETDDRKLFNDDRSLSSVTPGQPTVTISTLRRPTLLAGGKE